MVRAIINKKAMHELKKARKMTISVLRRPKNDIRRGA